MSLYLSIEPFTLYFTVNIHFHPTGLFSKGAITKVHVPFFDRAHISSTIVAFHFGLRYASFQSYGIGIKEIDKTKAFIG